jgi:hypothetical protein
MTDNKALGALAGIQTSMSVGVGVFGSAAAYALVWELGSRRLKNPGPKTCWGANRFGETVILTKQAPMGYVGIHAGDAQKILSDEVGSVKMDLGDLNRSKLNLEVALDNAAQAIARIMSDSAPVDSGDLRSQIMSISTDEAEFLDTDDDQGTLFL